MLAGCAQPQSALQRIRARGELRVVTLNAPTSYYLGAQGPQGFEYRLASAFARQLQVRLVMEPLPNAAAMRAALTAGRADLAAAQISPDAQWLRAGLPTENYDEIPQLVVQNRGKPHPRDLTGLRLANIVVRQDSPQLDLLRSISNNGAPELSWVALRVDQPDPLEEVTDGDADYAIVDANEFEFTRHLYPDADRRLHTARRAVVAVGRAGRRLGPGTGSEWFLHQRQGIRRVRAHRGGRECRVARI